MADQTIPSIKNLRGKIGIGLKSPSTPLHVKGNIRAEASGSTAFADLKSSQIYASGTYDIIVGTNNSLYFRTNDERRMTILNDGKVGIGTTMPSVQLDIEGSSNVIADLNTTTANANTTIRLQENGSVKATIGYDGTNDGLILTTGGFTAGNGIFIDDNQNVGIGATSPVSKLTVESSANALADVDEPENHHLLLRNPANDTTEGVGMGFLVSALTVDVGASILCKRVGPNAQSELQFWNKQNTTSDGVITQSMTIAEDGNLGIGVTDPSFKLDVGTATGGAIARFKDTDSSHEGIIIQGDTNGGSITNAAAFTKEVIYLQNSLNAIRLYTNGGERVRIASNGLTTFYGTGGGALTIGSHIDLGDNQQVRLGAGDDLTLYHEPSGENSYIDNSTGDLFIRNNSNDSVIIGHNANKGLMYVPDGRVELRFNDSKKFETTNDGVSVTGDVLLTNGNYIIFDGPAPKTTKMRSYYDGSQAHIAMTVANTAVLDLRADGLSTFSGDVVIGGGLTINGTTTTINSTTLQVDDKNIELGTVDNPTDTTAHGGGITLKGASDYTINWHNSGYWEFNQGIVVGEDGTGHDVVFYGDTADRYMTWDQSADRLNLRDHVELTLGTHNDLRLWYNNVRGRIAYTGGNEFQITASNTLALGFNDSDGVYGETAIVCYKDGAVKIRHDNSQKFTTDAGGITVTGKMTSDTITTALSLEMFASGGNNYISSEASGSHLIIRNTGGGNTIIHGTTNENAIIAKPNGAVELYHDNAKKFETSSTGATITGNLVMGGGQIKFANGGHVMLGDSNDLRLYHDGNSYIAHDTEGDFFIQQNLADKDLVLQCDDGSGGTTDYFRLDGSDAMMKAHRQLRFLDNVKATFGNSDDLDIYHDSSNNNNYIQANNGRNLFIESNGISLRSQAGENMITATGDGAVNLFHNNTTRLQTTSTGVRILGDKFGIYQGIEEDNYYFDDYNGARNVSAILNTQRADIIRYQSFQNLESWNGSAWVDASSQNGNLENLLDGRTDTSWYVPSTYYKFRFEISASTDWPLRALIGLQTSWSGSSFPECEMIVEEKQTDGTWATKVTAQFTSANGITNWGTMLRADSALHTGRGMTFETRITIDFYGWTPSNSSYTTIPLQNILISSNYSGNITHDTQNLLNYDRDILAPSKLGIGTTTPSRTLHVYDSAGPTIKFERSGSSNLEFQFGTTNTSIIGAGEIQFRANGGSTNKFIINNSQIQSNAKLLVNTNSGIDVHTSDTGTIIQSGNSSATSTPDQFFINHSAANVDMGNNRGNIKITKGILNPMFSDQGGGLGLEAMRWSYYPASSDYYLSLATEVPAGGVVRYHWNMKNNGTAYDDVMVFDRGNVHIGGTDLTAKLSIRDDGSLTQDIVHIKGGGSSGNFDMLKVEANNGDDIFRVNAQTYHVLMPDSDTKVGIGTTSPQKALEISAAGTSGGGVMRLTSTGETSAGDAVGKIEFYNSDTTDHTAGVMASIKAIAGPSGGEGHLQFLTDMPSEGAEANQVALHLHSNANVGIGTTSPTSKLEVSSFGAHGINISQDSTASTLSGRLFLSNGTTNQACTLFNSGGTLRFATGGHIGNSSGDTRMTLLADGKLGVGTTSPLGTVHIFTADAGAAIATNTSHDDLIIENGGNCGIQLSGPASSYQYLAFGDTASANQGYVRYYHTDNRMDLRAGGTDTLSLVGGKAGLGTTSVNTGVGIQVANGAIYATNGDAYLDTISAGYFASTRSLNLKSGASGKVILTTGSNDQLKADSGGFVELSHAGSTSGGKFLTRRYSGDDYLSVFSTEYSSGSLVLGYGVAGKYGAAGFVSTYDNFEGHKTLLKINHDGINVLTTGSAATDAVGADLSMAERFRVQVNKSYFNNGPVGIGTTSPAEKLHINGSTNGNVKALIQNTNTGSNAYATLGFQNDLPHSVQPALFLNGTNNTNYAGANSLNMYQYGSYNLGFVTNNLLRMTVTGSGDVCIGTTATMSSANARRLVVGDGAGTEGITIYSGSDSSGWLAFADGTSGDQSYRGIVQYSHANDAMSFHTQGTTERMRVNSTGLGIGTSAPTERLDVVGLIKFGNTRSDNTQKIARLLVPEYNNSHGSFLAFMGTANQTSNAVSYGGGTSTADAATLLLFYTASAVNTHTGTERMRVTSDGKVGIGTQSPQQELDVDGVIKQKVYTVSSLPTAGSSTIGCRAFVSDSAYAFSSSYLGYTVSGGGSNFVPVYSDGNYWYIG